MQAMLWFERVGNERRRGGAEGCHVRTLQLHDVCRRPLIQLAKHTRVEHCRDLGLVYQQRHRHRVLVRFKQDIIRGAGVDVAGMAAASALIVLLEITRGDTDSALDSTPVAAAIGRLWRREVQRLGRWVQRRRDEPVHHFRYRLGVPTGTGGQLRT